MKTNTRNVSAKQEILPNIYRSNVYVLSNNTISEYQEAAYRIKLKYLQRFVIAKIDDDLSRTVLLQNLRVS